MNTKKKPDWLSLVLMITALTPLAMYAIVGATFMPDVFQAREPPMMITRIISKLARTTGLSFVAAMRIAFIGPVVVAAILYSFRDYSRRKAGKTAESQPPPAN